MAQIYIPFNCVISAITRGVSTIVTTSENHAFVVGNSVRFYIPQGCRILQLNGLKGFITAVTDNTITVDINSTSFNDFVIPTPPQYVVIDDPQVIPLGDANTGYLCTGGVPPSLQTVPGAFAAIRN